MQSEFGEVTRYLLSIISHRTLRALVRQIESVVHLLTSKQPVAQSRHVSISSIVSRRRPIIRTEGCDSVHATRYTSGAVS
jgi:hypothetical protein